MIKEIKYMFLLAAVCYSALVHGQTTELLYKLGSSGSKLDVASIATDASGNIFICGEISGSVDFDPVNITPTIKSSAGNGSGFVAAYTSAGILKKVIVFGTSTAAGNNRGVKLYVDPVSKNVYLLAKGQSSVNFAGSGFSSQAWSGSMILVKYDTELTLKATRIFNNGTGYAGDVLNDLAIYGSDIYLIGTLFSANVEFNPGGTLPANSVKASPTSALISDIIVAKYDTATLINPTVYNLGGAFSDRGNGIDVDNSGNIYITGSFSGQNVDIDPVGSIKVSEASGDDSNSDAFVAKYNASMACQWAFNIGGGTSDRGNAIVVDKTNSTVYVGGIVKDDAISVYFDPASATSASFSGVGLNDIFVASYTSAGAYRWHLATGSAGEDELTSLSIDLSGNVVMSGYVSGTVDYGNSKVITGLGAKDAMLGVLSATSGVATTVYNSGGAGNEQANAVTVSPSGKILLAGNFNAAGDYDIAGTTVLTPAGTQDIFIGRYGIVSCTPPTVTGTLTVCVGSTTQLTGSGTAASGNPWVAASPAIVSVSNTGLVTGVASGTSIITYTNSLGCSQTATVTVNPKPTVTGSSPVCIGSTTQLSGSASAAASNAWVSALPTVASVNNAGLVTGVTAGTSTITYTNTNGCAQTVTITVNPDPSITGTLPVCIGATTQLTGSATAATTDAWVSASTSVATISNTGLVTGQAAGTSEITYTNSLGCSQTATITVNAKPAITGTAAVCIGAATQLTGSGTAAASNAWVTGSPSVASISSTGLVTGVASGTSVITYTNNNGCTQTVTVTVYPKPTIAGTSPVCIGSTIQLLGSASAASSNAWTTASPAVATIGNTGLITGIAAGTSVITYTNNNGCTQTATITVNPDPTVSGVASVCIGATTQLTGSATAASSNAWASASPTVASINGTGLVTGVANGTSIITYTNSNGCTQTVTVTVNPKPTITGTSAVCISSTTQLSGSVTAASGNAWTSASPSVATISNTGLVTGMAAGTSLITYTNNNGCSQTTTVTVNPDPTITGGSTVCIASTTQLTGSGTAASGNAWISASPSVATVSSSGLVTGIAAGTGSITYSNNNGCSQTSTVTVNPDPVISGILNACINSTTQLTGSATAASSNAWISASPSVATISNTGLVTGKAAGTSSITYTNNNGCTQTTTITVNSDPLITGTLTACIGSTTQLSGSGTAASSNAWVSGSPSVAGISGTGLVTGITSGTSIITYTNNNGCKITAAVTVNPKPSVTGTSTICVGSTAQLTGSGIAASSNAWISDSPSIASVNNTGLVTGAAAGTSTITYTNNTGCTQTTTITVNPKPAVTGSLMVCVNSTTQLNGSGSAASNNAWVSGTPSVAAVNATGMVTGVSNGTSIITYTNNNGCTQAATISVNPNPVITGSLSVCGTGTTQLSGSGTPASGNAWVPASPSIISVNNTGLVTGIAAGTSDITYTNNNGCTQTTTVTVNPKLVPKVTISTPSLSVCTGTNATFTATAENGGGTPSYQWKRGSTNIPGATTASYTENNVIANGTYSVTLTSSENCVTASTVPSNSISISVVSSAPAAVDITANPGNSICAGTSVTFTANPGNGGNAPTYEWFIGTVSQGAPSSVNTFQRSNLTNGSQVKVKMVSNSACANPLTKESDPVTMTVTPVPTVSVDLTADKTVICSNESVVFTASSATAGPAATYVWKNNNIVINGEAGATYTATSLATSNSIKVEMISSAACATSAAIPSNPVSVTVNPVKIPNVSLSVSNNTPCQGTSILFTASPTNPGTGPSYKWIVNDNVITGATGSTYSTAGSADGDVYSVELTSNEVCATPAKTGSNAVTIQVNDVTAIDDQPVGQSVCALGNTVTLSVLASGTNLTYQWRKGTSNLSNGSVYTGVNKKDLKISNISASELATNYNVVITGTCGMVTSANAALSQTATAITIISQPENQNVATGGEINLSVSASGPTLTYQWKRNGTNLSDNARISGATTAALKIINAQPSDNFSDYVCVISSPCAASVTSDAATVIVSAATSIQNAQAQGFAISPNPSSGYFVLTNVSSPFMVDKIEIISMQGVVVTTKSLAGTSDLNEEIQAESLPSGMYLVVIKGEGQQALLKIAIDR